MVLAMVNFAQTATYLWHSLRRAFVMLVITKHSLQRQEFGLSVT